MISRYYASIGIGVGVRDWRLETWTGHAKQNLAKNLQPFFCVKAIAVLSKGSLVGRFSVIAAPYDTDSVQTVVLTKPCD